MGLFKNLFKKNKEENELVHAEYYETNEIQALEEYIQKQFGAFETVLHEIVSPDIHVDIAIIPPSTQRDYYTLVTMGMGAHRMNIPKEFAEYDIEFAELIFYLPKDWNIQSNEEIWYWPIRWLKIMARLPIEQNTWLAYGHTVPCGKTFAENTQLNTMLLMQENDDQNESLFLKLPTNKIIQFYTMIPLYEEEVQFKLKNCAEDLLDLFDEAGITYPPVLDIARPNICLKK